MTICKTEQNYYFTFVALHTHKKKKEEEEKLFQRELVIQEGST